MPLTGFAYFEGVNYLRCTAEPDEQDTAGNPLLRRGVWECALPAGHEEFDHPRHQPHSWVQTSEE